jgi:cytochrome c553
LAVIAVIVLASVLLFVRRRRQAAAASNAYPFQAPDVEKQLDGRISPFDFQAGPPPQDPLPPPPRGSSLPLQPPAPPLDLRRQAYLNSQLQKLEVPQPNSNHPRESIVFGPLSSVPSESMPRAFDGEGEPPPSSPPLPPIPELSSRRAAYLREQLQRLAVPERRPSDGSVVFGPLSSVPSESTAQPYAPSVSTATNSPIQFLRHAPSQMTSPVSPTARRW